MSRHADLHRRSACARTVLLHECTDAECQFNHSLLDSALLEHVVAASLRSSRQCMVALVCSIRAGRVRWGSYMRTESRAGLSVVHTVPNASTARESLRKVLQKSQVPTSWKPHSRTLCSALEEGRCSWGRFCTDSHTLLDVERIVRLVASHGCPGRPFVMSYVRSTSGPLAVGKWQLTLDILTLNGAPQPWRRLNVIHANLRGALLGLESQVSGDHKFHEHSRASFYSSPRPSARRSAASSATSSNGSTSLEYESTAHLLKDLLFVLVVGIPAFLLYGTIEHVQLWQPRCPYFVMFYHALRRIDKLVPRHTLSDRAAPVKARMRTLWGPFLLLWAFGPWACRVSPVLRHFSPSDSTVISALSWTFVAYAYPPAILYGIGKWLTGRKWAAVLVTAVKHPGVLVLMTMNWIVWGWLFELCWGLVRYCMVLYLLYAFLRVFGYPEYMVEFFAALDDCAKLFVDCRDD